MAAPLVFGAVLLRLAWIVVIVAVVGLVVAAVVGFGWTAWLVECHHLAGHVAWTALLVNARGCIDAPHGREAGCEGITDRTNGVPLGLWWFSLAWGEGCPSGSGDA